MTAIGRREIYHMDEQPSGNFRASGPRYLSLIAHRLSGSNTREEVAPNIRDCLVSLPISENGRRYSYAILRRGLHFPENAHIYAHDLRS